MPDETTPTDALTQSAPATTTLAVPDDSLTPQAAAAPPAALLATQTTTQPATQITAPPAATQTLLPPAATQIAVPPAATQTTVPPAATDSGWIGKLEPLLKLAAVGFGLVAAMGLPAVYINFQRFGVPSHFISYDLVLRAGVVPTVPLVLVGLYLYAAVTEYLRGDKKLRFLNAPLTLSLPFAVVAYLVMLAGVFAFVSLELWALLWPVAWLLRKFPGWNISNRQLLIAPSIIALVYFAILAVKAWVLKDLPFFSLRLFRRRAADDKPQETEGHPAPAATSGAEPEAKKEDDSLQLMGLFFLGAPVYSVAMLYAIKGFLYLWSPAWSPAYLSHYYILTSGVAGGLVLGIFFAFVTFSEWLAGTNPRRRLFAFVIIISMVVMVLVASVSFYSYSVYPVLPQGLGGGKPAHVVVWFGSDDLPADLRGRMPRASFTGDDKVTRGENLYLLYESADGLILSDGDQPPAAGLRIAHDKVKAVSW